MERVQKQFIINDLEKKMVLIVGPRQAGKTWLAQEVAKEFEDSVYLNYDQIEDRKLSASNRGCPQQSYLF